jgi:beta-lactamase superfamily II metal-dependent hydrolase
MVLCGISPQSRGLGKAISAAFPGATSSAYAAPSARAGSPLRGSSIARNNTSLCLFIEADGERLLLPGDAEIQSWDVMKRKCGSELRPVDFLKVSHRGSHNGTPLELLDSLLPINRKAQAQVLVSTKRNVYGTQHPVPDNLLLKKLERRCRKLVATNGETGTSVHFFI